MAKSSRSSSAATRPHSEAEPNPARNVTLRLPVDRDYFPCPVCQGLLPVRSDRKGKPYVICDHPCGLQMFVRRPEGIRRLRLLLAQGTARDSQGLNRVLELWDYLAARLGGIRKLESLRGSDPQLEREENLILSQRERVRKLLIRELREKRRELLDVGHARSKE